MEEENSKDVKKEYVPFVMNRIFSYFPDTILIVNEMNKRQGLSKELHYKFLLYAISPKYRFKQMAKKEKNEDVELIMGYYNYSYSKAVSALQLLTDEQLDQIKQKLNEGGKTK